MYRNSVNEEMNENIEDLTRVRKICVTNRLLVNDDFIDKIERVAQQHPFAIILREKDLSESEYYELAAKVNKVCTKNNVKLILHKFYKVAKMLDVNRIHMSMHDFVRLAPIEKNNYKLIGVSVHSVEEACKAEELGADYITAGHIYSTDCKKGLKPRGTEFLRKVTECVDIPVYAIGGINDKNAFECICNGAAGVCIMSGYMK